MATGMLGMGLVLLVLSFMAPATSVNLQAAARGLRSIVPYPLLFGAVLLVLYAVLRPKPEKDSPPTNGPSYFGKNTTDFAYSQVLKPHEPAPEPGLHRGERQPASAWSAQVFEDIEWRRFEALCENLFGQAGFETRTQSHGADGGVDIWLYSRHAEGPAAIVQCKHWQGKPVGVKEVREFYGVMASHKLARGTFATSSTFTADARQFAKDNGINALDGGALLALISSRTPAQQKSLLAIAYEGEYWRPTCASCGVKMAERSGRSPFWGCVNFPRCRVRLQIRRA